MATQDSPRIAYIDCAPAIESFADSVIAGLAQMPKRLSPMFFYDERGSELFERICALPEYYLTRVELAILRRNAARLAAAIGPGIQLIEFGAGSLEKVRVLLAAFANPQGMTAIDISGEHLRQAAETLAHDFPAVPVTAVCADYTRPIELPESLTDSTARRIGFFPGSTIGNFTPREAVQFLRTIRPLFGTDGLLIVGVDLQKDIAVLEAAYDDAEGVTAAFNLNLLDRINRELGGSFVRDRFAHRSWYNAAEGRIEMHLVSLVDQLVAVAGHGFAFSRGETIHTENSYKYGVTDFHRLAFEAGWTPVDIMVDADELFSLHVLRVQAQSSR